MRNAWGFGLRWASAVALLLSMFSTVPAAAQRTANDATARKYFEAGRVAFEQADYESALVYFQHAYRMSRRAALQYNIGVAAERLQRDEEALEAFERYLEETKNPTRGSAVRVRIKALRRSIAEKEAEEGAPTKAQARTEPIAREQASASVPSAGTIEKSASPAFGLEYQKSEGSGRVDEPKARKKWPWIVAAAVAVVAGGVTAGVVLSKRENQNQPATSGLMVAW